MDLSYALDTLSRLGAGNPRNAARHRFLLPIERVPSGRAVHSADRRTKRVQGAAILPALRCGDGDFRGRGVVLLHLDDSDAAPWRLHVGQGDGGGFGWLVQERLYTVAFGVTEVMIGY